MAYGKPLIVRIDSVESGYWFDVRPRLRFDDQALLDETTGTDRTKLLLSKVIEAWNLDGPGGPVPINEHTIGNLWQADWLAILTIVNEENLKATARRTDAAFTPGSTHGRTDEDRFPADSSASQSS